MNQTLAAKDAYRLLFKEYPDVVDVEQMCRMLGGISIKTGYKLLRENNIECFKIGRAYKIPKLSILQFLKVTKNYIGLSTSLSL